MTPARSKTDVLEQEYLVLRAKILELAAGLDRLDRAAGSLGDDPRLERLRQGINLLLANQPDRAREMQLLFSREYNAQWRKQLEL